MRTLGTIPRWRTSPLRTGTLVLLAPAAECVPDDVFHDVTVDGPGHARALAQVQRMRGSVYMQDGAIGPSDLTPDGRHALTVDDDSWHVVSVQPDGRVTGCSRYRAHDAGVSPQQLGVWKSPLARKDSTRTALREALERQIALARHRNRSYVEVGGWAITPELRFSREALTIALATYALADALGGCIGITTATVRHCSSRILRKLGGRSLEYSGGELPSYYDPRYRCEMEVLGFDSDAPTARFREQVDEIAGSLEGVTVLSARPDRRRSARVFHLPSQPRRVTAAALECA